MQSHTHLEFPMNFKAYLKPLIAVVGLAAFAAGCGTDTPLVTSAVEDGKVAGIPASEFESVSFSALSPDDSGRLRQDTAVAKRARKNRQNDQETEIRRT